MPCEVALEKLKSDLSTHVDGKITELYSIVKDVMVLSYIPDWAYGEVDNIGLANNNGGVRLLVDWSLLEEDCSTETPRHYLLALYSRKTTAAPEAGFIEAYPVLSDWPECTSWNSLPEMGDRPLLSCCFEPGDGWKVFDITNLVLKRDEGSDKYHGAMLRFAKEDFQDQNWSGYNFVSREGIGKWEFKRPCLLVVER